MKAFLRRYLALATKEVQQLRRNRGLIVQLMIPPTIVLVLFGYALNPRVRGLRLGVVDESFTPQSRNFINALTENVNFKVTRRFLREQDAEAALNNLDLDLFLVIPHDFARSLARGQTASIQAVIDAVDANAAQIAQGYLERANLRAADDSALPIPDRRDREGDVQQLSILTPPDGLEMIHRLAALKTCENLHFFLLPVVRYQHHDGLTDGFLRRVAENSLGAPVPAGYAPGQVLANDRIVGAIDNRGQQKVCLLLSPEGGHVAGKAPCVNELSIFE